MASTYLIFRRLAYGDTTFRLMHHLLEIPYKMSGLSSTMGAALDSVARFHNDEVLPSQLTTDTNKLCLISPSHALEFRDAVERRPLTSASDLMELATIVHNEERTRNALHSAKKQLKKKKAAKRAQDTASTEELASRTKQQERVIEEMRKESVNLQARRLELTGRGADATMASKHVQSVQVPAPLQHFLQSSPLAKARIINTFSSKLNYILKEVSHLID